MSESLTATDLLGPSGPLAAALPGYEHREAQLQMARAVEEALRYRGIALCEAGTGTGKTLAYLVPALLSGLRVVVSTGTKTLQDQLMQHDLPLLSQHLFGDLKVACMKGLSNYVCQRRYTAFMASAAALSPQLSQHLPVLQQFRETSATGDRAEFSGLPDHAADALFREVQSGTDTRIGARCSHFDTCFVTRMRKQAADAQLIVVNHHLLFADLALKGAHGGGVIPEYDALIFDEAHLIEDIAGDFFGMSLASGRVETLVRDADRALSKTSAVLAAGRVLRDIAARSHQIFAGLLPYLGADGVRTPLDEEALSGPLHGDLLALDDTLLVLAALCRDHAHESETVAQLARRSEQIRGELGCFVDAPQSGHVRWTTRRRQQVTLGQTPVDVGHALREHLFQRNQATIFTSATLAAGGDFSFIKRRLGIDFEVDELSVPSPFDYEQSAALYLPKDIPDYRQPGFQEAAAQEVLRLVRLTGGGAFILCTSLRAMRALHKRCRDALEVPTFVQGEAPNAVLLERFRTAGNAVLFATMSFWQGVDVPGDALRLVVIDKLPFEVPSDPLVQARCQRITEEGKSAFMDYVVPAAALTLKQGFGRLIRKASDRGIVAILDERLRKKGYGKVFLRSLPPAKRCQSFEELEEFWKQA